VIKHALAVINGPNLNLLGLREPHLYGNKTLAIICADLQQEFISQAELTFFQSNHEGAIIDFIHACLGKVSGMVINPGAYAHTSIAIRDAIAATAIPCVEVHLSNIFARENFRQESIVASSCLGLICGFGAQSYSLGVRALLPHI